MQFDDVILGRRSIRTPQTVSLLRIFTCIFGFVHLMF
jgi:hypothetical protein